MMNEAELMAMVNDQLGEASCAFVSLETEMIGKVNERDDRELSKTVVPRWWLRSR